MNRAMNGLAQSRVDVYALNIGDRFAIEEVSTQEAYDLCGAAPLQPMYKVVRYHYSGEDSRVVRTLAYGACVTRVIFPNKAAALIAADLYNDLEEEDNASTCMPLVA